MYYVFFWFICWTNRPTDRQIDRVIGKFPFNNTRLQWNFVYDGDFSNMLKLHNMSRAGMNYK